jgi:broad specificity phosphatase PhoE
MPGGESAQQVLDRYLPVLTGLRGDLDSGDIIVVSHGAAIRLAATVLADVDTGFVGDNHLANTEAVVLAPVADGGWECVQWGTHMPPFHPAPPAPPVEDVLEPSADPMG